MYECPNCGGGLRFDPASQELVCDYCQTHLDPYQYEKEHDADITEDAYGVQIFTCPQCGGEIMTTNISVTGFCSYCGASAVLDSRMAREKRPSWIIPFKKTGRDCRTAYKKRIARSFYTPKEMRDETFMDKFRGIYIPYWVYEGKVDSRVTLKGTRAHRSGDYIITDHYDLGSDVQASYEGISYDASSSFSDDVSERIAPFDAEAMQPFAPSMLCGFYADTSDVPARIYADRAKSLAERDVYNRVSSDPALKTYDMTPPANAFQWDTQIPMSSGGPKLALFPVWFATYRKKDRVAYSVVNGLTGKIAVDLPVSIPRYLLGTLVLALPIFLLLNMFLTVTPETVLVIASVLAAVSEAVYCIEIRRLKDREERTEDAGYRFLSGTDKGQNRPKKRQKKQPKNISGSFILAALFMAFWAVQFVAANRGLFSTVYIQWAALAAAGFFACRTLTMAGERKMAGLLPGAAGALAAVVIGLAVRLLRPVGDIWYYSGAALSFAATGFSLIQVITKYNILATRPLPDFFDRRGGETGKAMLALPLALSLAVLGLAGGGKAASSNVVYTNPATGYEVYIDDRADLLNNSEEARLLESMKPVTEFGGAAFATTASNRGTAREYAEDLYLACFGHESGTLFLIDMSSRYLYIASDGFVYSVINTGRALTITDNVYSYARGGDYLACAEAVFGQINTLLIGGKIAQPMKYASNILLALILSLLLNYLIVRLQAANFKPSEEDILGAVRISFSMSSPGAVMTHTTRVYDPPASSGSDGGGRDSGGGGGGFSGGGGGHSF